MLVCACSMRSCQALHQLTHAGQIWQEGVFILAYDAFPVCGDGVDFTVDFHPAKGKSRNLLKEGYDPVPKGARPSRKRIEVEMLISPGDIFEFVVDPRENQDCDGIYIVEAKIWQSLTGSAS